MTPDDIRAALDRTFGGCCVRVQYELQPKRPRRSGRRRRRGGLLRPVITAAANRAWAAVAQYPVLGHGVVELDARRCVVVSKGYGEIIDGERSWHGAAGEPIASLDESRFGDLDPLLALELLRGAVEVVTGREVTVYCDLVGAADATDGDLVVPSSANRMSLVRRLPLFVRLDGDAHIRAVRHELEFGTFTLEVVERGVPDPDWTRIPDDT